MLLHATGARCGGGWRAWIMTWPVFLTCLLIVCGRIADVSLGTLRTIFVVRGHRVWACVLGFFEVLIWIFVVARVIEGINENGWYIASYALGFSLGNYLGITIERWLAYGTQILQVFTKNGDEIAAALRAEGYRLTQFMGQGREGPRAMLMIVAKRQGLPKLIARVSALDPKCYYTVEDIRMSSTRESLGAGGWLGAWKKK